MAHDIFISYSHTDKTIADAICAHLEGEGLRCWYAPRDIVPGADWADSIIQAIGSTKAMVLIFTNDSNVSQQVLREVSNAVSAGVPIVPFRLTEEEPIAGMKYYLSTVHWLDAMNTKREEAIAQLGVLCKAIVENSGTGKAAASLSPEQTQAYQQRANAVQQTGATQTQGGKKTPIGLWIGIAAAVVVIAVAAIILVPKLLRNGSETNHSPGGAGDANVITDDTNQDDTQPGDVTEPDAQTPVISDNVSLDKTETYTQGNTQGNLDSGGYITFDGDWYYYRSNDGGCIFKMRKDGSDVTRLTYDSGSYISVVDGYVYYYSSGVESCIKRVNTEGEDMSILHKGSIEDMRIVNDRIYYKDGLDGLHLYSMDLNGKNVNNENSLEKTYSWVTDGTYIYYANQNENGNLYRVKMDGSDPVCLLDHQIEGMTIAGNLLYFNDLNSNWFSTYDLTTGEVEELVCDYLYYLNVTEDGIYSYSGNDSTTYLNFVQLNGLGSRYLVEEPVKNVCVAGNLIYYRNRDDNNFYIVDLDGNNKFTP